MKKYNPFVKQGYFDNFVMRVVVLIPLGVVFESQLSFAQQTISCGADKVLICHKGKNTLCVSANALQAHLDHGDYLGSCNSNVCGVSATGGEITCKNPDIQLSAISNTTGVTYNWSGPNNFTSTLDKPITNIPGTYTVTITDAANGCTAKDTSLVTQNTVKPGAKANGGVITCNNTSVALSGSSSTVGVTYSWTGPNFTSTVQNPTVSTAGTFSLTVTNSVNGCLSTDTATVLQNITLPGATAIGGTITCTHTSVSLAGSSSSTGVTYSWSGPNSFTSTLQNPAASTVGTYNLTVTNPVNGCISTALATVSSNATAPDASANVSGTLTCNNTSVILLGNSPMSGVTYGWSGPLVFTSTEQNPVTNHPGLYTVVATNPVNGCSSSANINVVQDTSKAKDVHAAVSGDITCTVSSVNITGSSTTSAVTYSWTGPGGFSSANQNITVSAPGNYILYVAKPSNGCLVAVNANVLLDTIKPKGVVAEASGILSCKKSSALLIGSSTTIGVSYSWVGPGFISTEAIASITNPGSYFLTVFNPANGCQTIKSVPVNQNTIPPANVNASTSGAINCSNTFVTLTGSSSTIGVNYHWMGPDNFEETNAVTIAITPGVYSLTVTDPGNGCSSAANVTVTIDTVVPVSKIISPATSPVALTNNTLAAQTVINSNYSWALSSINQNWMVISGANNQVLSYHAGDAGTNATFTLTVNSDQNGCSSTSQLALTTISSKSSQLFATNEVEANRKFQIKTHPNPFTDRTFVEFTPKQNSQVIIELYTNTGTLLKVLFDEDAQASQSYQVIVDGSGMMIGTYHLIVKTINPNEMYVYKLVLIK